MTAEMVQAAGAAEGSLVVFHFKDGTMVAEILPPPTDEPRPGGRASPTSSPAPSRR